MQPFLLAPKDSISTPAFQVTSAGWQSRLATALANRAPSMCVAMPSFFASPVIAAICSGV